VRRIHVVHVLNGLNTGGTERGVRKLVAGLDAGLFEQTICALRPADGGEPAGARLVSLGQTGRGIVVHRLARLFTQLRPDIVHSRNWGTIEAIPAARMARVPAVVHSEHGRDLQTMGAQPWRRRIFRRLCYRWADRVFCVSQELRDFYAGQLKISPSRFGLIANGVDTRHFRPDPGVRAEMRAKIGAAAQTLVVGTVSRLDPVKDHGTLFQAARLVLQKGTDLQLLIVGDGTEKGRLEAEVAAYPELRRRSLFTGEVCDVESWLQALDVFALPSISEGMSNTLLEAMSSGVVPVATWVGGNPEVIEGWRSGLLFSPGDAVALSEHLAHLASDVAWRRQLGVQARERVIARFEIGRMLHSYTQLYCELAGHQMLAHPVFSQA